MNDSFKKKKKKTFLLKAPNLSFKGGVVTKIDWCPAFWTTKCVNLSYICYQGETDSSIITNTFIFGSKKKKKNLPSFSFSFLDNPYLLVKICGSASSKKIFTMQFDLKRVKETLYFRFLLEERRVHFMHLIVSSNNRQFGLFFPFCLHICLRF